MLTLGDQIQTDDKRIRGAVREANWASLRRDLHGARIIITVGGLCLIALVILASEPSHDIGSVDGLIVGFNQADSKWPNPVRTVTVRLDDGRTVIVLANGSAAAPNSRVRLREIQHLGWWRRTTFRLDTPLQRTANDE